MNLRDQTDLRNAYSTLIEVSNDGPWFALKDLRATCGLAKPDGFIGTQLEIQSNSHLADIEPGQKDTLQNVCPVTDDSSLPDKNILVLHFTYTFWHDRHKCFDITPIRKADQSGIMVQNAVSCPANLTDNFGG